MYLVVCSLLLDVCLASVYQLAQGRAAVVPAGQSLSLSSHANRQKTTISYQLSQNFNFQQLLQHIEHVL